MLFPSASAMAALTSLSSDPASSCEQAIAMAGAGHAFPPGMLAAIGQVESGRRDPLTERVRPWPWTVDVEGEGHFYDSKAAAIAAVRQFQSEGHHSIDVGCMQVNLLQHPNAFPSLEAAFDPMMNARYAAAFLDSLHAAGGNWMQAAGLYHSATPSLAMAYRQRVATAMGDNTASAPPRLMAMLDPIAPLGPPSSLPMIRFRPPPPRTGMITSGTAIGGKLTGRNLAIYRAAPVRRRS